MNPVWRSMFSITITCYLTQIPTGSSTTSFCCCCFLLSFCLLVCGLFGHFLYIALFFLDCTLREKKRNADSKLSCNFFNKTVVGNEGYQLAKRRFINFSQIWSSGNHIWIKIQYWVYTLKVIYSFQQLRLGEILKKHIFISEIKYFLLQNTLLQKSLGG